MYSQCLKALGLDPWALDSWLQSSHLSVGHMIWTDLGITYPLCAVKRVVLNVNALIIHLLNVTVVSHRKMEWLVPCDGHVGKEQSLSFLGTILSDTHVYV